MASATVSRAAVFGEHAALRGVGQLIGGMFAALAFAVAVLIPWRARSTPIGEMERALEANEFIHAGFASDWGFAQRYPIGE